MKLLSLIILFLFSYLCLSQANRSKYADVIFVLDEFALSDPSYTNWIDNYGIKFEEFLISNNIGNTLLNKNLYGAVLFGGSFVDNPQPVFIDGMELAPAQMFFSGLILSTNSIPAAHDGYAALELALDYFFRPNSIPIVIFISNRSRQIVYMNVTIDSIIQKVHQKNIIFNAIVNNSFEVNLNEDNNQVQYVENIKPALGISFHGKQRTGYYVPDTHNAVSSGNYALSMAARYLGPNSTYETVDDYVGLVEKIAREDLTGAMRSSTWDIKYLMDEMQFVFFNSFTHAQLQGLQLGNPTKNTTCENCASNYCYFLLNETASATQARQKCMERGAILADLQNVEQLQVAQTLSRDATWISSWQGNNFGGTCLILNAGAITIPLSCNARHNGICQVQKSQC